MDFWDDDVQPPIEEVEALPLEPETVNYLLIEDDGEYLTFTDNVDPDEAVELLSRAIGAYIRRYRGVDPL